VYSNLTENEETIGLIEETKVEETPIDQEIEISDQEKYNYTVQQQEEDNEIMAQILEDYNITSDQLEEPF
jgi:hypothetical protein